MLGSLEEAEDLVQETMLRSWRSRDSFQGRASLRTWLYKIATNACLDALVKRGRRSLPVATHPVSEIGAPIAPPIEGPVWLDPFPDRWLPDSGSNPEARYAAHESISLAFQVALQVLPARQRAVLILRDVLDFKASETARVLDTTVSAVNSVLNRARDALGRHHAPAVGRAAKLDQVSQAVLDRYVDAWELADVDGLVEMLTRDAVLAMPPTPSWYRGPDAIGLVLRAAAFAGDSRGRWRLLETSANGQPAFAVYQASASGSVREPVGVQLLTLDSSAGAARISEIVVFMVPGLVPRFGLPSELDR
jgi:RNA polymerase sigma-70 factor (ECF subfamily)